MNVFPHTYSNTSVPWATFRVMKLGHYVIVDDGGNYVTFHKLNIHIKIKKIITPHNDSLSHLCSSAIGSSKFVSCYLAPPPFWSHNDTKLSKPKNGVNFVKRALHVTKTCYISLTNIHSLVLQNETFPLVQSIQLSGKLSRLKNKPARKNVHASQLNANGSNHWLHLCFKNNFQLSSKQVQGSIGADHHRPFHFLGKSIHDFFIAQKITLAHLVCLHVCIVMYEFDTECMFSTDYQWKLKLAC